MCHKSVPPHSRYFLIHAALFCSTCLLCSITPPSLILSRSWLCPTALHLSACAEPVHIGLLVRPLIGHLFQVELVTRNEIYADSIKSVQQYYPKAGDPNAVIQLAIVQLQAEAPFMQPPMWINLGNAQQSLVCCLSLSLGQLQQKNR